MSNNNNPPLCQLANLAPMHCTRCCFFPFLFSIPEACSRCFIQILCICRCLTWQNRVEFSFTCPFFISSSSFLLFIDVVERLGVIQFHPLLDPGELFLFYFFSSSLFLFLIDMHSSLPHRIEAAENRFITATVWVHPDLIRVIFPFKIDDCSCATS